MLLRSRILRIAASLEPGNPVRKKLLTAMMGYRRSPSQFWQPPIDEDECPEEDFKWFNKEFLEACQKYMDRNIVPELRRRGWSGVKAGIEGDESSGGGRRGYAVDVWVEFKGKRGTEIDLGRGESVRLLKDVDDYFMFILGGPSRNEKFYEEEQLDVDDFHRHEYWGSCPPEEPDWIENMRGRKKYPLTSSGLDDFFDWFDNDWMSKAEWEPIG